MMIENPRVGGSIPSPATIFGGSCKESPARPRASRGFSFFSTPDPQAFPILRGGYARAPHATRYAMLAGAPPSGTTMTYRIELREADSNGRTIPNETAGHPTFARAWNTAMSTARSFANAKRVHVHARIYDREGRLAAAANVNPTA
jgi:hypothetical protein